MLWRIVGNLGRGTLTVRRITQAWIVIIIAGSLMPARPARLVAVHHEMHWLAFAGAAFLFLLPTRNFVQAVPRAASMLFLGVGLEFVQHLIYHIGFEWSDVRDDTLAILAVLAMYGIAGWLNAAHVHKP